MKDQHYNIHGIKAAYIHVSDVCNFKCKICDLPIEKRGNFVATKKLKSQILLAKKYKLKNLIFTGQEVLLHPDIDEICRFSLKEGEMDYITFNTNGLAFSNKQILKKINNLRKDISKIYFAISINFYNKKTFSEWSGHNEDVFDDWLKGVNKFLSRGNKISFDIILKKDIDIKLIIKFIEKKIISKKKPELRILEILPFGYTKGEIYDQLKYSLIERSDLVKKIVNSYKGKASFESFPFCIFDQKDLFKKKYFIYNFHVLYDKQLPVQYDPNIYETSFDGPTENWLINREKLDKSYKKMFKYLSECKNCYYKNICYGIEREYIKNNSEKKINEEIKYLKSQNWN